MITRETLADASKRVGDIRIGTSGWSYAPWRGSFFPDKLPQRQELWFASRAFRALEINGTFYGLQKPETFGKWAAETPADFIFAVKAPRYITHVLRLRDVGTAVANFFASGLLDLGEKLGAILWQLPPSLEFEPDLLEAFLRILPHDSLAAAELAAKHDEHVSYRPCETGRGARRIRHALEIRHDSFCNVGFLAMLRRYDIALVCADTTKYPLLMDATSDFVYCRLHGSETLYESSYGMQAIDLWAERVLAWANGTRMSDGHFVGEGTSDGRPRDVYLFFDNTMTSQAPDNARSLLDTIAARAARERSKVTRWTAPQPVMWSSAEPT